MKTFYQFKHDIFIAKLQKKTSTTKGTFLNYVIRLGWVGVQKL